MIIVKNDTDFLVNTTTTFARIDSCVTALSDGRFVVTWNQSGVSPFDSTKSVWYVNGQVFNADGSKSGAEFVVSTYPFGGSGQLASSVTALNDGRFVVTWTDTIANNEGTGDTATELVRGQIFAADGTKAGAELQVNTVANNYFNGSPDSNSSVTTLDNGRFVVTWTDDSDTTLDIFHYTEVQGQIFNADGTKFGSDFLVNTYTYGSQDESCVTALAGGGFLVTWNDLSGIGANPFSSYDVRGQIFAADGTKIGADFLVNTTSHYGQYDSASAALDDGTFVVTWTDFSSELYTVVRGQLFSSFGAAIGPEFLVSTPTTHHQGESSIATLPDGSIMVTWTDSAPSGKVVRGEIYTPAGPNTVGALLTSGGEFLVNTSTAGDNYNSSITALNDGRFVATWSDSTGAIRGQLVDFAELNYIGNASSESITGDSLDNTITGAGGLDIMRGRVGNDTFIYTAAIDVVAGEVIDGGADTDTIRVNDDVALALNATSITSIERLELGSNAQVSFAASQVGSGLATTLVVVGGVLNSAILKFSLASGQSLDLSGFTFSGTIGRVTITGNSGAEVIIGSTINDWIDGGLGNDSLDGGANGASGDTADYSGATETGVTVDLTIIDGQWVGGGLGTDTLTGIENLIGSAFDDGLTGDLNTNVLSGGGGDDRLKGGLGDDTLNGGAHNFFGDTADLSDATSDIVLMLDPDGNASVTATGVGTDTLLGIEAVYSGGGNDSLTGNGAANTFGGGDGNDTVTGGLGVDQIYGGNGDNILFGNEDGDYIYGGDNLDVVNGGDGDDLIQGGAGIDTLFGDDGDDQIYGGEDDDILRGGNGNDYLFGYSFADFGPETYEPGDDSIDGGAGNDALGGGIGSDTLDGGAGVDALNGGAGNDVIFYDASDNLAAVLGGADTDTLVFTSGAALIAFNLTTHEFEKAEGRFADTGANAWASYVDNYNANWQRTHQTGVMDDGKSYFEDYDEATTETWVRITYFNDALGRADVESGELDDGRIYNSDLDNGNLYSWSRLDYWFDSLGRADVESGALDDGRHYNSDIDNGNLFSWTRLDYWADALGRSDVETGFLDDGRTYNSDLDNGDAYAWDRIDNWADSLGRLDYQNGFMDADDATQPGWSWQIDYDQAEQFSWTRVERFWNAAGVLQSETYY